MIKPGTSALFLMVEKVTPDKAVEALSKYGGTVLKTSLSREGEKELQEALHGGAQGARRPGSGSGGICLYRPRPPRYSCFPGRESYIRVTTGGRTCCLS